ncbi:MAG: LuxR C-terminal-related transcriptional regulator [Zhongshania sp.]|uniref:response regulator transcription factor n=1 Tax=Zhongshania sp. TaxID=1971902 RepID=UPI002637F421|nr:LuxR C-terminal-related transcriptional regulator [Zhongshania sp.]MDF1690795.1 LuxR C-terminal-related transcriptional regulator [Zhongshania sp.]
MNAFSSHQHQFAQDIMGRSGANNFCLFLFSARPAQAGVHFFCHYGMSAQIKTVYSQRLWAHDPFLNHIKQQGANTQATVLDRGQLEGNDNQGDSYWNYINRVGYRDIVSVIHPYTPEIFLVGGLMGQDRGRQYGEVTATHSVIDDLDNFVGEAASELISSLIAPMLTIEPVGAAAGLALTSRERDVIKALQVGYGNKQIAAMLSLSEYTVENHFKRLFRKFAVHNRTALLATVQQLGLV